jgi:hypothetical protein
VRKLIIILIILIATVTFIRSIGPLNAEEHSVPVKTAGLADGK